MIVIAGLALVLSTGSHLLRLCAFYYVRLCAQALSHVADLLENWPMFWKVVRDPFIQACWYTSQLIGLLLVAFTPIFFMLRFERPRPPWRALLVQPGVVAGLAMVFGLFWGLGWIHILLPDRLDAISGPWIAIGGSVAAAWLILALCRRWRAEPGWVDRLGRLLGATAIATALLGLVIYRL
jgi:hypothetical protein